MYMGRFIHTYRILRGTFKRLSNCQVSAILSYLYDFQDTFSDDLLARSERSKLAILNDYDEDAHQNLMVKFF